MSTRQREVLNIPPPFELNWIGCSIVFHKRWHYHIHHDQLRPPVFYHTHALTKCSWGNLQSVRTIFIGFSWKPLSPSISTSLVSCTLPRKALYHDTDISRMYKTTLLRSCSWIRNSLTTLSSWVESYWSTRPIFWDFKVGSYSEKKSLNWSSTISSAVEQVTVVHNIIWVSDLLHCAEEPPCGFELIQDSLPSHYSLLTFSFCTIAVREEKIW